VSQKARGHLEEGGQSGGNPLDEAPSKRAQLHCQSRDWLGTFWAHSVSTEVNSGESHAVSFRSSVPVRLRDQHPETGSIPGSSTDRAAAMRPFLFGYFTTHQHRQRHTTQRACRRGLCRRGLGRRGCRRCHSKCVTKRSIGVRRRQAAADFFMSRLPMTPLADSPPVAFRDHDA
jgi:hypothetical protein